MIASRSITSAAALLIIGPTLALGADSPPDLKGKWSGKTFSIVAGTGGHWPENKGTFEKPGLLDGELTLTITGQEGRRFWGFSTIAANGAKTDEPFIGELYGARNRTVLIADTDGTINGEIKGNVLSFCYAHAGGPTHTSVVSCTEVRHAR